MEVALKSPNGGKENLDQEALLGCAMCQLEELWICGMEAVGSQSLMWDALGDVAPMAGTQLCAAGFHFLGHVSTVRLFTLF